MEMSTSSLENQGDVKIDIPDAMWNQETRPIHRQTQSPPNQMVFLLALSAAHPLESIMMIIISTNMDIHFRTYVNITIVLLSSGNLSILLCTYSMLHRNPEKVFCASRQKRVPNVR